MLDKVKEIAMTVFKFSADMDTQDEDEDIDIDSSNEMKLLEKVVQKLAIIAEMQTAKRMPEKTEDMNAEDIGILSMMHGKNIVEENEKHTRRTVVAPVGKKNIVGPQSLRIEDIGVTQENFNSWNFNTLKLNQDQRKRVAEYTISRFHENGDGFITTQEDVAMLQRFLQATEKEYLPVPFHSFAHASDVVFTVARLMRLTGSEQFMGELEQFSLLIAAVAHDIGHPGVNNGFLSEVGHELALEYNDRSPLENMHCAKLYKIVANPQTNVFATLTKEQYKEVRKYCIETILHTDMTQHTSMVKDLQMLYQMNMEVFADSTLEESGGKPGPAEVEVFSEADAKTLVMDCFLHSADVSNPCRKWEVTQLWAMQCLEEFFMQGDQEKEKGIPVQFLNDRDKLNKPHSQIGFIEFMIAPFFAAQLRLWPSLSELGDNLGVNLACWKDMWIEETSPGEEDKEKVEARVDKVRTTLQDSSARAPM
jgi:cAMP-specific phosphodiesterase 4